MSSNLSLVWLLRVMITKTFFMTKRKWCYNG